MVRLEEEICEDIENANLVKSLESSNSSQFDELTKIFWKYAEVSSVSKSCFFVNLFLNILSKNKAKGVSFIDPGLDYTYFKSKVDWILSPNDNKKNDNSAAKIKSKAEKFDRILIENSLYDIYEDLEHYIAESKKNNSDTIKQTATGEINYSSFCEEFIINEMNDAIKRRLFEKKNNLLTVVIVNNRRSKSLIESLLEESTGAMI